MTESIYEAQLEFMNATQVNGLLGKKTAYIYLCGGERGDKDKIRPEKKTFF